MARATVIILVKTMMALTGAPAGKDSVSPRITKHVKVLINFVF